MNSKLPKEDQLLTRQEFDEYVKLRSRGMCVFCNVLSPKPAVDAHHIFDRKLFTDGGYYLGNGAAVCEDHHWDCEITEISLDLVWKAAGIVKPVLPPGFQTHLVYDKWGNICNEDGTRTVGPLGRDTGVMKAIRNVGVYWLVD